jgi:hypothetical protein
MLKICDKPIFIVCSASSGSTLLSNLLSKHPNVLIGPEMYVFDKKEIYGDYKEVKNNIRKWLKKGLLTKGQVYEKAFFFNKEFYNLDDEKILSLFERNDNIKHVVDELFSGVMAEYGSNVWGEKTGSNGYCLKEIIKLYPNAKIIHLIRNPIDAIASVSKRNSSIYNATEHYIYNNVKSLDMESFSNYKRVKYEDLVSSPINTMADIFEFVEVDKIDVSNNKSSIWEGAVDMKKNTHVTWGNSPTSPPSNSSIGRGEEYFNAKDLSLIHSVSIDLGKNYNLNSVAGLMKHFEYDDKIFENVDKKNILFEAAREYYYKLKKVRSVGGMRYLFEYACNNVKLGK